MNFWKVVLIVALLLSPVSSLVYAGCGTCPGDEAKSDCSTCESKSDCGTACGAEPAAADPAKVTPTEPAKTEPAKVEEKGHEHTAFPTVTGEELSKLIADKVPVVILDARSGKWDDGKRIPGAKQLTDTATPEEVAKLVPAKDAKVVTYCSNLKCPASLHLAEHLKKLGYTNVVKYPGGLEDWLKSGKEVVSEKK
ncbi:MAG TPA: rhodanese-like domain-containing protein [Candidatus Ozemobacteraceae bacterium]|nr:rhodanese-like domain-containing protein [Candidatus Ozemobacteraceae bacterium]